MLNEFDFYRDERVIRRILEYCGVPVSLTEAFRPGVDFSHNNNQRDLNGRWDLVEQTQYMTAEYLVGSGRYLLETREKEFQSVKIFSLGWLLDHGLDVFRSIWDKQNTLGILDVEYFSRRHPGLAYSDPAEVYGSLEPLYHCLMSVFFRFGFNPIVLATGQGYHFVFRVRNTSPVAQALVELGHVEESTLERYRNPGEARDREVSLDEGKRYDAMGKLIEYLVHFALSEAPRFGCQLPIMIGDIAVGNVDQEAVNLDLSCYANPLFMRDIRLAFSTHQKHKMYPKKVGEWIFRNVPIQISVPRYTPCNGNELSLEELFLNRRHFHNSANYAGAITTEIPENSDGVWNLIQAYLKSSLYAFHRDFDETDQDSPDHWRFTYDRFDDSNLPPCVAQILRDPNPNLLQPTQLQTLIRTLCSRGWWHPKHVAGLIRSKYERDHAWEIDWRKYDPAMWANVWTRFYAGLLADGTDGKIDFNCISHQEKGIAWAGIPYCLDPDCNFNLTDFS
jgi:hypothetical protein